MTQPTPIDLTLIRTLKELEDVRVCVVKANKNDLFVLKGLKKSRDKFEIHRAEYDFMEAHCTAEDQRFLVHLFACFQNKASTRTLILCIYPN